jgi:Xaa-Pro aminopeptidase
MAIATTDLRLAAVRELFSRAGVDALLVSGPENRRYLSGFTAEDWGIPGYLKLTRSSDFRTLGRPGGPRV